MQREAGNYQVVFQFTRPHGTRWTYRQAMKRPTKFQLTRPSGRDELVTAESRAAVVSIHVLTWSTKEFVIRHFKRILFSIHVSTGDTIRFRTAIDLVKPISIHAPSGGCDVLPPSNAPSRRSFNSRAPWGRDLYSKPSCVQ